LYYVIKKSVVKHFTDCVIIAHTSTFNFTYLLYLKRLFAFLLRVNYIRILLKNVILVQFNSTHTQVLPGKDSRLNTRNSYKDICPAYIFRCFNHVVVSAIWPHPLIKDICAQYSHYTVREFKVSCC
jgi:hypothetical protein